MGFEQLPDEIGGAREEHAAFLLGCFDAERDRQVRFAGADRPGDDQILGRSDPFPAGERVNLRGTDALDGGEIKGIEGLDLGKPRLAQSLTDHGLVSRGLLGAQHLLRAALLVLSTVCRGDVALQREVESLLCYEARDRTMIDGSALQVLGRAMAVEQSKSWIGRQVSHYRILSLLGRGGMG